MKHGSVLSMPVIFNVWPRWSSKTELDGKLKVFKFKWIVTCYHWNFWNISNISHSEYSPH